MVSNNQRDLIDSNNLNFNKERKHTWLYQEQQRPDIFIREKNKGKVDLYDF